MAFDFKKEYKEFYMPKNKPEIVTVPKANYIAVRGSGDPNEEGGAYQQAIRVLYAVAYTLKMSEKAGHPIHGSYEYVVPPLEGFWWQDGVKGVNYADKAAFHWISVIIEEGLCVQIMHIGAFDDEPATVALMDACLAQNGYVHDFSEHRLHHEIYLSDARKVAPEKRKTVIRHPIKKR